MTGAAFAASLERRIRKAYEKSGNVLGWRFLSSPAGTLDSAEVALTDQNPGGDRQPDDHPEIAIEKGSAYEDEKWDHHPPEIARCRFRFEPPCQFRSATQPVGTQGRRVKHPPSSLRRPLHDALRSRSALRRPRGRLPATFQALTGRAPQEATNRLPPQAEPASRTAFFRGGGRDGKPFRQPRNRTRRRCAPRG